MNMKSMKLMSTVFLAAALVGGAGTTIIGTAIATADQAEARMNDNGKRKTMRMRDHRSKRVILDHRRQPVVRDHRTTVSSGAPAPRQTQPVVRDHRTTVSSGAPAPRRAN